MGRAVCRRLVAEGAFVAVVDRNIDAARLVVKEAEDKMLAVAADVSVEADVERAVRLTAQRFGNVDIGINAAGIANGGIMPVQDMPLDRWRAVLGVNLDGIFFSIKHTSRQMIAQGTGGVIINVSSVNAIQPGGGMSAYCVSKSGVSMLTSIAALDLAQHGIRVVAIGPGVTDTAMTQPLIMGVPATLNAFLENIPVGRVCSPEEIASTILFLASEEASYHTGTTVFVDGGLLLRGYPKRPVAA
jgi:NAD(P)-dependent dehydrogenase (short-subunit alcohol dehydrogenase family)